MKLPRLIQLTNNEDEHIALYVVTAPLEQMSDSEAIKTIEITYDYNFESDDVIESASKELETLGIFRIFAEEAKTDTV